MEATAKKVTFKTIGIPHLQIGDFLNIEEASTYTDDIFRIDALTTVQKENGYTMVIDCHEYTHS